MFYSGSEATFVNPQPPIEFVSGKKSVLNTVLYRDGKPYLSISTLDNSASCTRITDLQTNQLLVTIQRKTFSADTITFHQRLAGQKLKINDWLKEGKADSTRLVKEWSISNAIGNYKWRRDGVLRLALHPEYDTERPIAWVRPETPTENVALIVKRGAENFMDEIISAFVLLEQQLRLEKQQVGVANAVADAKATTSMFQTIY